MIPTASLITFSLLVAVYGQQVGTLQAEVHPTLSTQTCTAGGSCTTKANKIVLDSNWRYLHQTSSSTNCYTGNEWDTTLCPDPSTCATNCAVDGADYTGTYGITTSSNELTLKFVTDGPFSTNIGSRVFLMADDAHYEIFNLKNQEFTFTVDMSQLPCGLNGALYFVQMDADGGVARFPANKAGAAYGTGYCDSQCPHDLKFIDGAANVIDWTPSPTDVNSGTGMFGTCCTEMDVWEANSMAEAVTPHVCTVDGQTQCSGTDCGDGDLRYDGVCDKDGCDYNSFRMGDKTFLGPGMTVDTTQPITVIRRLYVQNGQVIPNSQTNVPGMATFDSVTDAFCDAQKAAFGDTNSFESRGGLARLGDAFQAGMVLVMSLWDDHDVNMLWLDSDYPAGSSTSQPGIARGSCATTSGVPTQVEAQSPNAQVTFSNIKVGPIGSTF
ncbi:cellobiohydrolaseI [Amylostereum chailletii]|nr:cellobiohydrolaseI [Amylostereum chailletii]